MNNDLTICGECGKNPAVYGDGITWSRCSFCQNQHNGSEQQVQEDVLGDGVSHNIVDGLVSIIIPVYMNNYTLFHYTGNCIGSIREHTNIEKYEIVIVDNGSPIKPPSLHSYYAHRVIQNDQNLGVTKAWNQGIRASVGEYICLMNNDVQVFDGWLETMKNSLDNGLDLVMAHPMYSLTEPFARAVESSSAQRGMKHFDDIPGGKDFSCVMMKRSLLDEMGLFDEYFFTYCSDIDFLKRLDIAGKKYRIVPAYTSHISDATGFSIESTPDIMNEDSRRFKEKWESKQEFINLTPKDIEGDFKFKILIRTPQTGDDIFLLIEKKYHHIKDPETLFALGYSFGQEEIIRSLDLLEKGEEINMEN